MVNVKSKLCEEDGCKKIPYFNFEGELRGVYCASHKKTGMVNVKSKLCEEDGCKKQPYFNFEGELRGVYCASHKKTGMINVITKLCEEDGCKKKANYNFEGQKTRQYCATHKKNGMVNIYAKLCREDGCNKIPSFNFEEQITAEYCLSHKKPDMINVISKLCQEDGCKKQPTYNFEGKKRGIFCVSHKKTDMINVVNMKCKTHLCYTQVNNKYKGYCLRCFIHTFPDKPNSRNYKTKEISTTDYIKKQFPELPWVFDSIVSGGCSRRRPDAYLDLGSKIIVVEIDENQHIDYDCSCENRRLMEISQDFAHRPIIFIRFNPDDYINQTGEHVTSCWGVNGKVVCCVKKNKIDEWNNRLQVLNDNIKYWIENDTDKTIEVVQLFYNI
jgi:hypothetical protein